jgi:3-isopropylmalate dehydrogenase
MTYRIAAIGGDGIGPEVLAEGRKVLEAVSGDGLRLAFEPAEVGAALYRRTGEDLPRETLELCRSADAILFGAAGLPDVRFPDGTEIAPQVTLRFLLDLYAGVRPIRLYPGVPTPLRLPPDRTIDYVIFRENVEGLFASRAGGAAVGEDVVADTLIVTRKGTERIVRRAFETAVKRGPGGDRGGLAAPSGPPGPTVTCVDKANIFRSYAFFRKVFREVAAVFPGVATDFAYMDAMTMYVVQAPWRYDVVVLENLFGDILSDLGAATVGGLGMAPSGDIGDRWALFQPSHGTAPDIAGRGVANPIAMILSAAMMLDWLGDGHRDPVATQAARRIERAVTTVLEKGTVRTPDIGGRATTRQVGDAVATAV